MRANPHRRGSGGSIGRLGARLVAGAAVASTLAGMAICTGAPAYATGSKADAFVTRINDARQNHDKHALTVAADLVDVAEAQAHRMANSGVLFHNPNLTTDVKHWLSVGENIGAGGTVSAIANAFMASPEHRANILSSDYTQVGVGVVTDSAGRIWVVEDFRKPDATYIPAVVYFTHTLRLGSRGVAVSWVQRRLHLGITGYYGYHTKHRVRLFKVNHGLHNDGIVGLRTWRALHR